MCSYASNLEPNTIWRHDSKAKWRTITCINRTAAHIHHHNDYFNGPKNRATAPILLKSYVGTKRKASRRILFLPPAFFLFVVTLRGNKLLK